METVKHVLESAGFETFFLDRVDSTNTFLKDRYRQEVIANPKVFCTAIEQTNGYGQRERSWLSNKASIKVSLGFELMQGVDTLFLRGLKLSLIIRKILSEFHHEELLVKWPNDIYSSKGKVCGILTEVVKSKQTNQRYVVIGIGINTAFSLQENFFKMDSLTNLTLIEFMEPLLPLFEQLYVQNSVQPVSIADWEKYDLFKIGSQVSISEEKKESRGIYCGLSDDGFPVIQIDNNMVTYSSANISLKSIANDSFKEMS